MIILSTLSSYFSSDAMATKPPKLLPYIVAEGMASLSIREIIWSAITKMVRFSKEEAGARDREKPGMSKVVTVNFGERRVARVVKEWQSPSPEGMRRICGPEPLCSTCQEIPSSVCI